MRSQNKSKATWQIINNEINSTFRNRYIDKIEYDNKQMMEGTDIAEAFNNYFISIGNKQNSCMQLTGNSNHINDTIYLNPVNRNDIIKIIASLNNTNSEGHDGIATQVIKECREEISDVLAYVVNISLETGVFPEILKRSVVKPLYKKKDRSSMANYRPITLIPIFSKIFEKIMHNKLTSFFGKHNVIHKTQYGFQKHKSTTLAAFDLITEVLRAFNAQNYVTVLFFDMTKAFDLVPHKLLLSKLEHNGIRGPALKWLETYLVNRKQCVEVSKLDSKHVLQDYRSDYKINHSGVPQGSVLGPLLFILFINDIINLTNHKPILFADDLSIVVTSNKKLGIDAHKNEINIVLTSIMTWLNKNNLEINIDKSNFMNFNKCNDFNNIDINGKILNKSKSVTFLGLIIDDLLNWKDMVNNVCNRINSFSFALYKLVITASRNAAVTAYYGYVESVLRYGLLVWGNSTDINKVFDAQKKCIRAIFRVPPYEPCRPLFRALRILPLPCLYIFEVSKFVKMNPRLFTVANEVFVRNTRNPDRLVHKVAPKSAVYLKNCESMAICIYNKIPRDIKELHINKFRKELFRLLMDHCFYSVKEFLDFKKL